MTDAAPFPCDFSTTNFNTTTHYYSLSVPAKTTGSLMKILKPSNYLLGLPKMKNVYPHPTDTARRMLVLNTVCEDPERMDPTQLPAVVQPLLSPEEEEDGTNLACHPITTTYLHCTLPTILKHLLPTHLHDEIPSSFETVGTLAHVNLRDEYLPYKLIIGRVIMDKNPSLKKVVNKIDVISTQFRTFPMECIGGKDNGDYECEVKEGGYKFKLDFSKVYWNSRLQYEHRRLAEVIGKVDHGGSHKKSGVAKKGAQEGVVAADVMAGIGPFAVPLGVMGVKVLANDLNPHSYKYLDVNVKMNKCESKVESSCLDGREFVHKLTDEGTVVSDVIMNLPATAVEFLDAFRGWNVGVCRPMVHVYCFVKCESMDASDAKGRILPRVESALGCGLAEAEVKVHIVRDVAPKKPMCCVSFRLPEEVAGLERVKLEDYVEGVKIGSVPWEGTGAEEEAAGQGEEQPSKKQKV